MSVKKPRRPMDNVLDDLFSSVEEGDVVTKGLFSDEVAIPKRCAMCKTAVVCSMLPTFMNLSKIRVFVSIDQCPYSQPLKNAEIRKVSRVSRD
jgi:hypothetical protein